MSLEDRVEVLHVVQDSWSFTVIGSNFGVNESIVCYIKKNETAVWYIILVM